MCTVLKVIQRVSYELMESIATGKLSNPSLIGLEHAIIETFVFLDK